MEEFNIILERATAALSPEYFLLPVQGGDFVYRERVYCYELYHQLRCQWPDECEYVLNGEVDKQQHPNFDGPGYPKPDFIVHVPGSAENFAAIEVKGPGAAPGDIRTDLSKLLQFQRWYPRLLYLVYGVHPVTARNRIVESAENEADLDAIELWVHSTTDISAISVPWDGDQQMHG